MSHGALALMVPTIETRGEVLRSHVQVSDYATALDGLVLQGGVDIGTDTVRDDYEMALIRGFIEAGKPVLGICRGAQLINVVFGGTLHPDIPQHRSDAYEQHAHEMRLEPGSRLAALYPGVQSAHVTSIHHQAIDRLGAGLVVEAWSDPDGLVEAVRAPGSRYIIGVQWHPEFHPENPGLLDSAPILNDFVEAARRK